MFTTAEDDVRSEAKLYAILIFLNGFVSLAALLGGLALIARPNGSLLGLDTSILTHSGFSDFLVPGIILVICVGFVPLTVAYWLWRRNNFALLLSLLSSTLLLGWVFGETLLIRLLLPLHLLFIVIAALMVGITIQIGREDAHSNKRYFGKS